MWCGPGVLMLRRLCPLALLAAVDQYTGPGLFKRDDGKGSYAYLPRCANGSVPEAAAPRRQFPVVLAFAITVHKSQGLTLDKAVLDISGKDHTPGLTYVAISRVKKLSGLLFEKGFDKSDLNPQ